MVINGLSSNLGPIWVSYDSSLGVCIFYMEAEQVYSGYSDGRTRRKFQEIGKHRHKVD